MKEYEVLEILAAGKTNALAILNKIHFELRGQPAQLPVKRMWYRVWDAPLSGWSWKRTPGAPAGWASRETRATAEVFSSSFGGHA